jgi:hypothetical protein
MAAGLLRRDVRPTTAAPALKEPAQGSWHLSRKLSLIAPTALPAATVAWFVGIAAEASFQDTKKLHHGSLSVRFANSGFTQLNKHKNHLITSSQKHKHTVNITRR